MHVKTVKINVYCLLMNEFNLNVRLNDTCSMEPKTYFAFVGKIKTSKTKTKNQNKKRHSCVISLSVSQIFQASIPKPVFTSLKGPKFVALIGQHRF